MKRILKMEMGVGIGGNDRSLVLRVEGGGKPLRSKDVWGFTSNFPALVLWAFIRCLHSIVESWRGCPMFLQIVNRTRTDDRELYF